MSNNNNIYNMKLIITKENLIKALQKIIGVVEKRQTMPILSHVLFRKINNEYEVVASDLEVQITSSIVLESGSDVQHDFTIPGRKLFDIGKQLAKTTSIGFYIYSNFNNFNFEIFCNIHENGNVEIKSLFDKLLSVDDVTQMMLETINNKILNKINVFLKQKGYNYYLNWY